MGAKVYVAGPMTGLPEFNYPAFRAAGSLLAAEGFDVLNPVEVEQENASGEPQAWDWYMRRALRMVVDADGVALLPGWERSRGARLEFHVATSLELDVRPLDEWLKVGA